MDLPVHIYALGSQATWPTNLLLGVFFLRKVASMSQTTAENLESLTVNNEGVCYLLLRLILSKLYKRLRNCYR